MDMDQVNLMSEWISMIWEHQPAFIIGGVAVLGFAMVGLSFVLYQFLRVRNRPETAVHSKKLPKFKSRKEFLEAASKASVSLEELMKRWNPSVMGPEYYGIASNLIKNEVSRALYDGNPLFEIIKSNTNIVKAIQDEEKRIVQAMEERLSEATFGKSHAAPSIHLSEAVNCGCVGTEEMVDYYMSRVRYVERAVGDPYYAVTVAENILTETVDPLEYLGSVGARTRLRMQVRQALEARKSSVI